MFGGFSPGIHFIGDSFRGKLVENDFPLDILNGVKIEVRAVGLKKIREAHGLTQRQLAQDLGISQNYIPAIESGARRPGPRLQEQFTKYFKCAFEDLFEIVLVDPESGREQVLQRK